MNKAIFHKPNFIVLVITGLLCYSPYLFTLFTNDYVPNWDEAIQLNSADRLYEGLGLTYLAPGGDFSRPVYKYLSLWPPGHSLFVALFLNAGFGLSNAAIIVKFIFIVAGLFGFVLLASRTINSLLFQMLFLVIVIKFQAEYLLYYTSDSFIFSLFPYSILLLVKQAPKRPEIITAGIIIALMIFFKYTALSVLFLYGIYFIYLYRGNFWNLIRQIVLLAGIPVLTYLIIFMINKHMSSRGTEVTSEVPGLSLLKNPALIPGCLITYFNSFVLNAIPGALLLLTKLHLPSFVLSLSTLFFLFVIFRNSKQENYCMFLLIAFAAVLLFFFLLSVVVAQTVAGRSWWPLIELRYYAYMVPAFALALLLVFEKFTSKNNTFRLAGVLFFLLPGIYFMLKAYMSESQHMQEFNKDKLDISTVMSRLSSPAQPAVFSSSCYPVLKLAGQYPVYAADPADLETLLREQNMTGPVRIFLVYKSSETKPDQKFKDFIETNRYKEEKCNDDIVIYWNDYQTSHV